MQHRILAILRKIIIESDYKTAKTKFMSQGIKEPNIDSYFKKFKEIKNQNKIKEISDKNIDTWAKKPWGEFKKFVDKLQDKPTRREEKKYPWKMETPKGAKKIFENDDWVIYYVGTWEAVKALGTRNWCIVRQQNYFDEYIEGGSNSPNDHATDFYIALSKKKSYKILNSNDDNIQYDDPDHRIAIEVTEYDTTYWDADDDSSDDPPENFPDHLDITTPNECSICSKREDTCDCCYNCERSDDDCNCCSECESTDRDDCGCWCPACRHVKENCGCDRCTDCKELIERNYFDCTCARCGDCKKLPDDCECNRCDECNKLVDDCECEEEEKE